MSEFLIGEDVPLITRLIKNNKPLTGETVTVRVLDQATGVQLLASVAAPETSEPGVYRFLWTTAPQVLTKGFAIFDFGPRTTTEFFSIVDPTVLDLQVARAIVKQDIKISARVIQDNIVKAKVITDSNIIKVLAVPNTTVFAKTSQPSIRALVICD